MGRVHQGQRIARPLKIAAIPSVPEQSRDVVHIRRGVALPPGSHLQARPGYLIRHDQRIACLGS